MLHPQVNLQGVQTFRAFERAASVPQGGHLGTGPVVFTGCGREQRGYFIHNSVVPEVGHRLNRWLDRYYDESESLLKILGRQPFHYEVLSPEPLSPLELGGLCVNFDTGVFVPAMDIETCRKALENPKEDMTMINGLRIVLQALQTPWLLPDFSELGVVTQPDRAMATLMIDELFRESADAADDLSFHRPQESRPSIELIEDAWSSLDSINMILWMIRMEESLRIEIPDHVFGSVPSKFGEHFRQLFEWARNQPPV